MNYWNDNPASLAWENRDYQENSPLLSNGRFNTKVSGSGLSNSGNSLVTQFDRAFSTQWLNPVDTGLNAQEQHMATSDNPFVSAARDAGQLPELDAATQAGADLNADYDRYAQLFRNYTTNEDYLDAFADLGIDPSTLNSPEALAAISPDTKAGVFDLVGRSLQKKNQRAKRGIGSSLAFSGALGLAGLLNPFAAAGLGMFARGLDEGPLGAGLGFVQGLGIGDTVTNGINIPDWDIFGKYGGRNIVPGLVQNGVPTGINPLDINPIDEDVFSGATGIGFENLPGGGVGQVYGPPGVSNIIPGGLPPIPDWQRGPQPSPNDETPFSFPPIPIPVGAPPGPVTNDPPPSDNPVIPPFVGVVNDVAGDINPPNIPPPPEGIPRGFNPTPPGRKPPYNPLLPPPAPGFLDYFDYNTQLWG